MSFCCTGCWGSACVELVTPRTGGETCHSAACGPASTFGLFCQSSGSSDLQTPLGPAPSAGGRGDGCTCGSRQVKSHGAPALARWLAGPHVWLRLHKGATSRAPSAPHLASTHGPRHRLSPWSPPLSLDVSVQHGLSQASAACRCPCARRGVMPLRGFLLPRKRILRSAGRAHGRPLQLSSFCARGVEV